MWVKICANTCLEDALLAAELGADAVGFVFAPSRRRIATEQALSMTRALPAGMERVGVFAGTAAETIADTVEYAGLTAVQLHDGWSAAMEDSLRVRLGLEFPLIWTVSWAIEGGPEVAAEVHATVSAIPSGTDRILLDARAGGLSGGLGVSFDWQAAAALVARHPERRFILAGGLKPENVVSAIELVQPYGVDVASGVERVAGRKHNQRLRQFIESAKASHAQGI